LYGFENQRWIRRGITRLGSADLQEISGIGNDGGELFELIELIHGLGFFQN
jgi:hypothetical protein